MSSKETGILFKILVVTLHSIVNIAGRTCVSNQVNKHVLPRTVTKSRGGPFFNQFFLQMFHQRYANAT